jgi:hypothetical protein
LLGIDRQSTARPAAHRGAGQDRTKLADAGDD